MSDLKRGAFVPIFIDEAPGFAIRPVESVSVFAIQAGKTEHIRQLKDEMLREVELNPEGFRKNRKQRRREAALKRKAK